MPPVEQMRGKFAQKNEKTSNGVTFFVGTGRRWSTTGMWSYKKLYRTTPVKPSETAARLKFATVHARAIDRSQNAQTLPVDRANFRNQTRYKTFLGFLFHLEWDNYQG